MSPPGTLRACSLCSKAERAELGLSQLRFLSEDWRRFGWKGNNDTVQQGFALSVSMNDCTRACGPSQHLGQEGMDDVRFDPSRSEYLPTVSSFALRVTSSLTQPLYLMPMYHASFLARVLSLVCSRTGPQSRPHFFKSSRSHLHH